jgi:hypothetical protein
LASEIEPGDSLCIRIIDHPASWLLQNALIAALSNRHVVVRQCAPGEAELVASITRTDVHYNEIESGAIERTCTVAFDAVVPSALHGSVRARLFNTTLTDTVDQSDVQSLEAESYPFTKGIEPTRSSGGFWHSVVEPVVVLSAAVVTVILLFSVRSQ